MYGKDVPLQRLVKLCFVFGGECRVFDLRLEALDPLTSLEHFPPPADEVIAPEQDHFDGILAGGCPGFELAIRQDLPVIICVLLGRVHETHTPVPLGGVRPTLSLAVVTLGAGPEQVGVGVDQLRLPQRLTHHLRAEVIDVAIGLAAEMEFVPQAVRRIG